MYASNLQDELNSADTDTVLKEQLVLGFRDNFLRMEMKWKTKGGHKTEIH